MVGPTPALRRLQVPYHRVPKINVISGRAFDVKTPTEAKHPHTDHKVAFLARGPDWKMPPEGSANQNTELLLGSQLCWPITQTDISSEAKH